MIQRFRNIIERWTDTSIIGVDIGSEFLKVAEVTYLEDEPILKQAMVKPIDGDRNLAHLLKEIIASGNFGTHRAALALASSQLVVHPLQFPNMPEKELSNAVHLQAEQLALNGHTVNELAIDWHRLNSNGDESIRTLLAVIPKNLIHEHLEAPKAAGLIPVVLDVEGLALWNAYWMLLGRKEPLDKTVFIVNVGARKTNLLITKGRDELILLRDFEMGTKNLDGGLNQDWLIEIQDSLAYARSKNRLRSVEEVLVTGGNATLALKPLLQVGLPVSPKIWNPLNQMKCQGAAENLISDCGPALTIAIGLALRKTS